METEKTDIVIVGTGASGLFAALHLPRDKRVLMITKDEVENSDSFLAQGASASFTTRTITTVLWKIHSKPATMKTGVNPSIS